MDTRSADTGSPKEKRRVLRIIAAALSAGVFIFSMVSLAFNQFNGPILVEELEKYK